MEQEAHAWCLDGTCDSAVLEASLLLVFLVLSTNKVSSLPARSPSLSASLSFSLPLPTFIPPSYTFSFLLIFFKIKTNDL